VTIKRLLKTHLFRAVYGICQFI